jgi:hypothetical protein
MGETPAWTRRGGHMKPLQHLPPRQSRRDTVHELIQGCAYEEAGDVPSAALKAAYYLFQDIAERIGVDQARAIFAHYAKEPSAVRLKQIRHEGLLWRYRQMRPKPNVQQFVKIIAAENAKLPGEKQHGPWGTDPNNLDKLMRRLIAARRHKVDISKSRMSRTKPKIK